MFLVAMGASAEVFGPTEVTGPTREYLEAFGYPEITGPTRAYLNEVGYPPVTGPTRGGWGVFGPV